MNRSDLASFVPVLCGALIVAAVEFARADREALALDGGVSEANSDASIPDPAIDARAMAAVSPAAARSWPGPGARLVLAPSSKVRIRLGEGATSSAAIGHELTGFAVCGKDGMPEQLELRFALNSIHGAASELVREVIGVHRASNFEFVGRRVESRERPAAGGVLQLRFEGSVRVGANARRLVVALECLPGVSGGEAMRAIGIGTIRASDYGLSAHWGLGPWSGERSMTVVWELAFATAKE